MRGNGLGTLVATGQFGRYQTHVLEIRTLSDDGPDHRTPSAGIGGNEQTCKCDHGSADAGTLRAIWLGERKVTKRGEDDEAGGLESSTTDQTFATSETLDEPQAGEGHDDVHSSQNDGGDKGVVQPSTGKNRCAVVEEVVGTGQLL